MAMDHVQLAEEEINDLARKLGSLSTDFMANFPQLSPGQAITKSVKEQAHDAFVKLENVAGELHQAIDDFKNLYDVDPKIDEQFVGRERDRGENERRRQYENAPLAGGRRRTRRRKAGRKKTQRRK